MKSTAICFTAVFVCMAVLIVALPVTAQTNSDFVFPEFPKLAFPHDPLTGVDDFTGWFWHPGQDYVNVAGVQFVLKYDPYEVNILGITNFNATLGGVIGPLDGHIRFDPPNPLPPSSGTLVPNGALPAAITGTVWVNHDIANNSGLTIPVSQTVELFDLFFEPRHTSQVNLNSDTDIRVSQLRPIYHVTGSTHLNTFWEKGVADGSTSIPVHGLPGGPLSSIVDVHLEPGDPVWHHVSSVTVPGKLIPHSNIYFQGPLVSSVASAPTPLHASGTIPASALVHGGVASVEITTTGGVRLHWGTGPGDIPPSVFGHLPGPVTSLSILIQPSSFYVGDPVGGEHLGLGIDHFIPEPATLVLLAIGGLAAAMQRWTRRRRRA